MMLKAQNFTVAVFLFFTLVGCSSQSSEKPSGVPSRGWRVVVAGFDTIFQSKCSGDDRGSAESLEEHLLGCELSDSRTTPVSDKDYGDCAHLILESYDELKSKDCQAKYLPRVQLQIRKNLDHQISAIFIEGERTHTGLNQKLPSVFSNLDLWSRSQAKGRVGLARFDAEHTQDIHQILSSLWTQILRSTRSTQKLVNQQDTFSHGLSQFTQMIQLGFEKSLDPELIFRLLGQSLTHVYERVQFFSELSDLYCQLGTCSHERESDLHLFILALSQLGDPHSLGTSEGLRTYRQSIHRMDKNSNEIKNFLSVFSDHHAEFIRSFDLLIGVMKVQENSPSLAFEKVKLIDLPIRSVPAFAVDFVSMIQGVSNQSISYRNSGLFQSSVVPEIDFGLTPEKINENFTIEFKNRKSKLEKSILDFKHYKENLLNTQKSHLDQVNQGAQLMLRHDHLSFELSKLQEDLQGYQGSLQYLENTTNQYAESTTQLLQSDRWKNLYSRVREAVGKGSVTMSAQDAHFIAAEPAMADVHAFRIIREALPNTPLLAGDLISIHVTGKWSPACALHRMDDKSMSSLQKKVAEAVEETRKAAPSSPSASGLKPQLGPCGSAFGSILDSLLNHEKLSAEEYERVKAAALSKPDLSTKNLNPMVGPEGYSLVQTGSDVEAISNGQFKNSGSRFNHTKAHTSSDSTGMGFNMNIPILGFSAGSDHRERDDDSSSQSNEVGLGDTDTSTRSKDVRSSASYDVGLRLPHTPFPQLPAGSLLMVMLPPGESRISKIQDIQVVRPQSSFLIPRDADVYFVANDCKEPGAGTAALTVGYSILRPLDSLVQAMTEKMLVSLDRVRNQGEKFLKSGEVTVTQMSLLQSTAYSNLAIGGEDPEQIKLLHSLFKTWISNEIVKLELKSKILHSERKITLLSRQVLQVENDMINQVTTQKIAAVLLIGAADNFDLNSLGQELRRCLRFLNQQFFPILKIESSLDFSRVLPEADLEFLQSVGLSDSLSDVAQKMLHLLGDLEDKSKAARSNKKVEPHYLVVNFPMPFSDLGAEPYQERMDRTFYPYVSEGATQHPWRAFFNSFIRPDSRVSDEEWERHTGLSTGVMKISPEDVYVSEAAMNLRAIIAGSLPCNAAAPIVDAMGIYFELKSSPSQSASATLNKTPWKLQLKVDAEQVFPYEKGVHRLSLAKNWTDGFSVPVIFGENLEPVHEFKNSNFEGMQAGQGISPFSHFTLNFDALAGANIPISSLHDQVSNMMLVFRVHTRTTSEKMAWLPRCGR